MARNTIRNITQSAVIAALYLALGLALAPLSFGPIQLRVAELLTILPLYSTAGIWGVTLGCFLTNLLGALLGVNPIGLVDMVFGTVATLIAALLTYRLRGVTIKGLPLLALLMPVIVNAVVIPVELCLVFHGGLQPLPFALYAGQIAASQAIVCVVVGGLLYTLLARTNLPQRVFKA